MASKAAQQAKATFKAANNEARKGQVKADEAVRKSNEAGAEAERLRRAAR
jgi:hypothetical protein